MGTTYLLDTNTVIYILNDSLPEKARDLIKTALNEKGSYISLITKIELLGWYTGAVEQLDEVSNFVQDSEILPLTDAIIDGTIAIRRSHKIKLPDAIIAATAMAHGLTLISRNDDDFRNIPGLKYLNPFRDI